MALLCINGLTLSRLIVGTLAPVVFFSDLSPYILAGCFAYIFGSDLLDGQLARRMQVTTNAGSIFDYITDRYNFYIQVFILVQAGVSIIPFIFYLCRESIYIAVHTYLGTDRVPGTKYVGFIGTAGTYLYTLALKLGFVANYRFDLLLSVAFLLSLGSVIRRAWAVGDLLREEFLKDVRL
jgi:phosphatidylglycerophosphate synthase